MAASHDAQPITLGRELSHRAQPTETRTSLPHAAAAHDVPTSGFPANYQSCSSPLCTLCHTHTNTTT